MHHGHVVTKFATWHMLNVTTEIKRSTYTDGPRPHPTCTSACRRVLTGHATRSKTALPPWSPSTRVLTQFGQERSLTLLRRQDARGHGRNCACCPWSACWARIRRGAATGHVFGPQGGLLRGPNMYPARRCAKHAQHALSRPSLCSAASPQRSSAQHNARAHPCRLRTKPRRPRRRTELQEADLPATSPMRRGQQTEC